MTTAAVDLDAVVNIAKYTLAGVDLEVNTTDDVVAALIGSRLKFVHSSAGGPASIEFDIRDGDDDDFAKCPDGPGRPVYDAPGGQLMYFAASDQLHIDYAGALRALCSPAVGLVQSSIRRRDPGRVLAAHPFFTIPLLETMKRRGRYSLHAACLAIEDGGVLLAGGSGAGKSTLALALARGGWDFLSDDMVFLDRQAAGIRAWGFSDEVDVSDRTAAMFPELRHLVGRATLAGRDKHAVHLEECFAATRVPACQPRAVVVPEVSDRSTSVLKPMSPATALRELSANVLLTEPVSAQAHLDILAELVRDVPCFSLSTGSDLDYAAACVREALG